MANPTIPFKGEFGFDDESAGAENNNLNAQMIDFTYTPEKTGITRGPYLSTNHREELVGSTGVTVNFTIGKMTTAQMIQFNTDWEAGTLMEAKYMAEDGTLDSPTTTNPQVTVQFYLKSPPVLAGVQDEEATWSPGDILATYFLFDDGATPTSVGTAA